MKLNLYCPSYIFSRFLQKGCVFHCALHFLSSSQELLNNLLYHLKIFQRSAKTQANVCLNICFSQSTSEIDFQDLVGVEFFSWRQSIIYFFSVSYANKVDFPFSVPKLTNQSVVSYTKSPERFQIPSKSFRKYFWILIGRNSFSKKIDNLLLDGRIKFSPFLFKVRTVFNVPLFWTHVLSYILLRGLQKGEPYQFLYQ